MHTTASPTTPGSQSCREEKSWLRWVGTPSQGMEQIWIRALIKQIFN